MTTRSPERVWAALLMSALALPAIANAQSEQVVPIGGRLVDPDGTPVRDARVAILTERNVDLRCEYGPGSEGCFDTLAARGGVRAEGRSNPDGRFTLAVPGGLTNFDHIWADGQDALSRRLINSLPIRPNRPTTATDLGTIALNRARELLVVVHGGGRPIAGAEVVFNRREKLWTDQAGEVLHRVFAPAASESSEWMAAFTVRAPGFAVDAWFGGLPAGSTTRMIDLVPEVPLAGRVWDSRGLPVPDGDVFLRPVEPWLGPRAASGGGALPDDTITSSRTDAMGRFLLHGLSPSRTYRVVVEAPGRLNAASVERVVSGGTAAMDVVLSAAGRVEVDVSGPPGTESCVSWGLSARAERRARREAFEPADLDRVVRSGRRWMAAVGGAAPGRSGWSRACAPPLRSGAIRHIRVVTAGDGTVAGDVSEAIPVIAGAASVVELTIAPVRQLRLQVVDAGGRLVRRARVEAFAHTGRSSTSSNTDADGVATLQVHPAHDVKVTVTVSGQAGATVIVSAGVAQPAPIVVGVD
jgi:hypothetical protein